MTVKKIEGVHPRGRIIRLVDQLIVGANMPQDFRYPCVIISFKESNYLHSFCIFLHSSM